MKRRNKTEIATLEGHSDRIMSVAFNTNGTILASGSFDNTIKLWNVETKTEIATLKGHSDRIMSVAFNTNGTILASGSWNVILQHSNN